MNDDEKKAKAKERMDAAIDALRNAFAAGSVRAGADDNTGHKLAFDLLKDAMTKGSNVGMAKKKYSQGTSEDERRVAGGIIQLLRMMAEKMEAVITVESAKLGDEFAVRVDVEDGYDCGNPDCPIHGTNAAQPGDILNGDQLGMLPPEMAAQFAELIKQGLIVKHVGHHGPFGAMELQGPKHLLEAADAIMKNMQQGVTLPAGIENEINKPPMDTHTQEISDALDRALGKNRSHLPKKDLPLS